jgi:hypothetical protein
MKPPRAPIGPTPCLAKAILFHPSTSITSPTCLAIVLYAAIVWRHLRCGKHHPISQLWLGHAVTSFSFIHPRCRTVKSIRQNHPDRIHGNDAKKAATAKFSEISAMYKLLTTRGDVCAASASHPSFSNSTNCSNGGDSRFV